MARKYKMQCEEQTKSLKSLEEALESTKAANILLENEKNSLEVSIDLFYFSLSF